MLNCFVRSFSRNLFSSRLLRLRTISSLQEQYLARRQTFTFSKLSLNENNLPATNDENYSDIADYMPLPLKLTITKKEKAVELLVEKLNFSTKEALELLKSESSQKRTRLTDFGSVLDVLSKYKITKESVKDNAYILSWTPKTLAQKIACILSMHPRNINDLVPMLRASVLRLERLSKICHRDLKLRKAENRIYFISDKLDIEPYIVSKYVSKRLFMLEIPFDNLSEILDLMIEYEVNPMSILKDLWAFRYAPCSVRERFERARQANKQKLKPWMVRCTEPILEKTLNLSKKEKEILGETNTLVDYISSRLGFDMATTKSIMDRHPALYKVRVPKIKAVIDFVLSETRFTRFDIACCPRIFCHSLRTTKQRLAELKSYNCSPIYLITVCKSKRQYKAFIKAWIDKKKEKRIEKLLNKKHEYYFCLFNIYLREVKIATIWK